MAIERWRDPYRHTQNEMNRLFDRFFGHPESAPSGTDRVWMPLVDLYETPENLVLNVELPGIREKAIALSLTDDVLTVRGERQFDEQFKDGSSLHLERAYGRFERSIRLPMPVNTGLVKATYRDGVLEVTLPKADELRPKEIEIQAA
jgi:HSP20 family protein